MSRELPSNIWLVLFLILGAFRWQRTVFPLQDNCLLNIQLAAYQWKHGDIEWMYTPVDKTDEWRATWGPVTDSLGGDGLANPYFYPPFLAAGLSPFSEFDARSWRDVLFGINVVLIFVNAWLILSVGGIPRTWRYFLWAFALVLLTGPLARSTVMAQIVPFLAALTWLGLLRLREQKDLSGGVLLGVVSAIKLFPVGVIVVPAIARRFKAVWIWVATIFVIFGLSIWMMGFRVHQLFWQATQQFGTLIYPYRHNQSLVGWFARVFRDQPIDTIVPSIDPGVRLAYTIIAIIMAGVTVGWIWWNRRAIRPENLHMFAALLMAGMILALSNSWDHYWMWLVPVMGWALYEEWTFGDSRARLVFILVTGFLFIVKLSHFYNDSEVGRLVSGSHTVGMLMLWMWLIWRIRRTAQEAAL